jgi:hypothetical protein
MLIGHLDFYTAYDMFPGEALSRIQYLMRRFGWGNFEAKCYFYSEPYEESDWIDYD